MTADNPSRTWPCLATCTVLDLPALFGPVFARDLPQVSLLAPDQIDDPTSIEIALSWKPAPDAFARYPNLRAVFSVAAGVDAIRDCPSLPDVPVYRVEDPDQALQMAGFAAFHTLWHHRRMGEHLAAQRRGEWVREIRDLSPKGRRVGVMGFGLMGRAIAAGLSSLGYPVTTLSRRLPAHPLPGITHLTSGDLPAFLAGTDILINVLPLTPETVGLLDRRCFAALPAGAALIQLGRGPQLVEPDLIAALDSGHLSGASLDVFATEPLPPDSPLWHHPRVVITPHVASTPRPEAIVASVRDGLARLTPGAVPQPASASS